MLPEGLFPEGPEDSAVPAGAGAGLDELEWVAFCTSCGKAGPWIWFVSNLSLAVNCGSQCNATSICVHVVKFRATKNHATNQHTAPALSYQQSFWQAAQQVMVRGYYIMSYTLKVFKNG